MGFRLIYLWLSRSALVALATSHTPRNTLVTMAGQIRSVFISQLLTCLLSEKSNFCRGGEKWEYVIFQSFKRLGSKKEVLTQNLKNFYRAVYEIIPFLCASKSPKKDLKSARKWIYSRTKLELSQKRYGKSFDIKDKIFANTRCEKMWTSPKI